MATRERKRWRLTFETGGDAGTIRVVTIAKGDAGSVDQAVGLIRAAIREAMKADGCRLVAFGVHVEGAACDHEVG